MKSLELFLENPFKFIFAGKEKMLEFYEDHKNSLSQQVSLGAPFAALIAPTIAACDALGTSLLGTAAQVADQISKTYTVDELMELFVAKAKGCEASIRDKYGKDSAIYVMFYPQGMKPFNQISKRSIKEVMNQFLTAYNIYKADLGVARYDELVLIHDNYIHARSLQIEQKSETKNLRSSWDDCLEVMQEQAFTNLLTIALHHKGHPAKIKLYFNQSIVAPVKHNEGETPQTGYILPLPINGGAYANISYSADEVFLVSNNSTDAIFYCGVISATTIPSDAELIKIEAGEQTEVTAISLGAPLKKFWYFVNKNTTTPGEVEIIQI